jgi:hypothetical protein
MQKSSDSVVLAQKMIKDLERNWLPELELANLHTIFRPIYKHNLTILNLNAIVVFIILAYSEESSWLNPRKDRLSNKKEILEGIGVESDNKIYTDILHYENDAIQQVILNYLLFNTDARWFECMSLLEYANKNLLFCNQKTSNKEKIGSAKDKDDNIVDSYEFLTQSDVAKINKEKGDLLLKAIEARNKANAILDQIEKDFQKVDNATQGDFGFAFSDAKNFSIESWEHRVRRRKQNMTS